MNTSALKAFAPAVRKQLIEAVTRKLDFALTARTPDYLDTYATQVRALRELAAQDSNGLIERVAYTWFNRFAALRYLDAKGWHPFRARVLTAALPDETLPGLLKVMRAGALPDELRRYTDVTRLESLLTGQIPSADPQAEVYRHLVLAACRFYHGLLPDVFERLDDETELLLPDDLLTEQSVVEGFRREITDEDCEQVEVLGWLYQFYVSEKKDQVMARKAAVPAEDIPAVTQLFTPHWIVRYLVENSLGRLWLLNRPDSLLKEWMPYYIEGERETQFLRIARPQDIRLCDPAAGSGHMLTYSFDLLYVIYEEEGYAPSEIPGLILRHNLTGIEIDARAAQLAALALTLKGREKSPRFFQQQHFVRPNIIELRNVHFAEGELAGYSEALGLGGLFTLPILKLMHQFEEGKTFGSLIQPCVGADDVAFARGSVQARDLGSNLFLHGTHKKVLQVLDQAEALTQRYQVVVANPPYLGGASQSSSLRNFLKKNFEFAKPDLFSAFILRNRALLLPNGLCGMMTPFTWFFILTYAKLRMFLLRQTSIQSAIIPEYHSFFDSAFVPITAFVFSESRATKPRQATFIDLGAYMGADQQEPNALRAIKDPLSPDRYTIHLSDLIKIPETPFAYKLGASLLRVVGDGPYLGGIAEPREGINTGDNERFMRFWFEVGRQSICIEQSEGFDYREASSLFRWFPCNKGGPFRRWYGNNDYVVDWAHDGNAIRNLRDASGTLLSRPQNTGYFFRQGVTWSGVGLTGFSARLFPTGFTFNSAGRSLFTDEKLLPQVTAFLNSTVTFQLLKIISPTLSFTVGNVANLPFKQIQDVRQLSIISDLVDELVSIARADWDSFENSWDFHGHPVLSPTNRTTQLEASWQNWRVQTNSARDRVKELEAQNNSLFIEVYDLKDTVDADVAESQITLARAEPRRDMASFLSYVVGCTMGRYSLDHPGLILANSDDGLANYVERVGRSPDRLTFAPDRDGIIAVLDDEWFPDDIVARTREFLKATFGEATLRENIRFIEESLGRDLRSYFLTDFYKDHLQTYKKRPIYWMVQSPRKGFSVLIYLHRYTRDTMNVILNRYLREFQVKLRSKIDHLQQVGTSTSASNREKTLAAKEMTKLTKTLHECEEWERQTILPLAQARIELDLDDGVKVNYLKLGEALAPIPGLAAAEE